jgi:hypothetical protein
MKQSIIRTIILLTAFALSVICLEFVDLSMKRGKQKQSNNKCYETDWHKPDILRLRKSKDNKFDSAPVNVITNWVIFFCFYGVLKILIILRKRKHHVHRKRY